MQNKSYKDQMHERRAKYVRDLLLEAAARIKAVLHPRPACVSFLEKSAAFNAQAGDALFCVAGSLWVTQGDSQDYILIPGDTLTLSPRDTVVVVALDEDSRYRYCQQGHEKQWKRVRAINGVQCCAA